MANKYCDYYLRGKGTVIFNAKQVIGLLKNCKACFIRKLAQSNDSTPFGGSWALNLDTCNAVNLRKIRLTQIW